MLLAAGRRSRRAEAILAENAKKSLAFWQTAIILDAGFTRGAAAFPGDRAKKGRDTSVNIHRAMRRLSITAALTVALVLAAAMAAQAVTVTSSLGGYGTFTAANYDLINAGSPSLLSTATSNPSSG